MRKGKMRNAQVGTSQTRLPHWLQGTEMGEVIFAHDWADSGLGPLSTWPGHLKFAVSTMLLMPSAAILLWGRDLLQIYNDSCRDLMGGKHSISLGRPIQECWPEIGECASSICDAVMQRWKSFDFEDERLVVNRNEAPEEVFVTLTYSPVPGNIFAETSSGETTERAEAAGVLVTVNETTKLIRARACEAERVQLKEALAEQALRESQNRFRHALEIDTVGVVFFDNQGVVTEANNAFLKMSGFSREDQKTGKLRSDDLMPPVSYSTAWLEELEATGRIAPYERELFHKDGTRWWALVATKRLHYDEIVAYVIDISERRRIEESLRESETRFRTLVEASPALIWQRGPRGDLIYVNQRAAELMDMSVEVVKAGEWRSLLHPQDAPAYLAAFDKAILDRSYFKHRARIRNREGGWRWMKTYAMPWFTAPGSMRDTSAYRWTLLKRLTGK